MASTNSFGSLEGTFGFVSARRGLCVAKQGTICRAVDLLTCDRVFGYAGGRRLAVDSSQPFQSIHGGVSHSPSVVLRSLCSPWKRDAMARLL